jgi:uncharacterized repeat protein (TIGR03803 family)
MPLFNTTSRILLISRYKSSKTIVPRLKSYEEYFIRHPNSKPMSKTPYPSVILVFIFIFLFQVSSSAQTSSFISKPLNNELNVAAPNLKITASTVEGATRYTIQISTSPSFTTSMQRGGESDHQRTYLFSGLKYSTVYYARAKTDISDFGRVSVFTTQKEIFPIVTEPSGTAAANPVVFRVNLTVVPGASRYTVELNTKPDFSGSSIVSSGIMQGQTTFLFRNLSYSTNYFIRAKTDISTSFGPALKTRTRPRIEQQRLWGMATAGGAHGSGTVISLSVDSATFRVHHDYQESGEYPYSYLDGSLVHAADGGFFASSECERNGTCANGEVLHISPLGEVSVVSQPYMHRGGLMLASNDLLYIVDDWINLFQGGIVRIPSRPTVFDLSHVLFRLQNTQQGQNPHAPMIELRDGYFYGLAPLGGAADDGVMYRIRPDGSGFRVMFNFNEILHGGKPQGSLMDASNGYLYGTTSVGGSLKQGTVFRIRPDGSDFKKIVEFSGANGAEPLSDLVESSGKIYGFTRLGGDYNKGVLFSVGTDGTSFKKLLNFSGSDGSFPENTPTIVGEVIYGMTTYGGMNDKGSVFKIRKDGTGYHKLHDFGTNDGAHPKGALLLSEDFFNSSAGALASSGRMDGEVTDPPYSLSVFPNPFTHDFTTEFRSDNTQLVKLVMTNMYGEIVVEQLSDTNTSLSFGAELQKGIYVLKVIMGEEVANYRLVKN